MIDRFTNQDLLDLVKKQNDPCVTIYLATEKTGREIFKPVPRLKKLVDKAQQKLAGHWMSDTDAAGFLEPIVKLTKDDDFWQQTENGLALFLNADHFQQWRVGQSFAEQAYVSRQFFLHPMLSTIGKAEPFYVLSLGQKQVELFESNLTTLKNVNVPNLPTGIEDALNETFVDRGLQMHTGSREQRGKQSGVFHGQGVKAESKNEDLRQYYRQVNDAVATHLQGQHQPLVLACVADHISIYRDVNTYPHLLSEVAAGGPEQLAAAQLFQKARPIVEQHMNDTRQSAVNSYRELANTPSTASEASALLAAAHQGRIDKLFVQESASIPGKFNESNQTIDYEASTNDCDLDLVEDAIAQTLLHRGEVFAASENELPGQQPMVAILRY